MKMTQIFHFTEPSQSVFTCSRLMIIIKKTLCEICPTLTRKAPDQICKTTFLQICSFSTILVSLYSLNLSFPLLFYVISTATFIPCNPTLIPHIFTITTQIPCILTLIHFLAFSPLFSALSWFCLPISRFDFYRQSAQSVIFNNFLQENRCFSSKTNIPLCYNSITLGTKLLFTLSRRHRSNRQTLFNLQCL